MEKGQTSTIDLHRFLSGDVRGFVQAALDDLDELAGECRRGAERNRARRRLVVGRDACPPASELADEADEADFTEAQGRVREGWNEGVAARGADLLGEAMAAPVPEYVVEYLGGTRIDGDPGGDPRKGPGAYRGAATCEKRGGDRPDPGGALYGLRDIEIDEGHARLGGPLKGNLRYLTMKADWYEKTINPQIIALWRNGEPRFTRSPLGGITEHVRTEPDSRPSPQVLDDDMFHFTERLNEIGAMLSRYVSCSWSEYLERRRASMDRTALEGIAYWPHQKRIRNGEYEDYGDCEVEYTHHLNETPIAEI